MAATDLLRVATGIRQENIAWPNSCHVHHKTIFFKAMFEVPFQSSFNSQTSANSKNNNNILDLSFVNK